ncbi:hypothetical protein ACFQY7_16935 [Actinomadura luteofluorescens]|uniref:hypothetical protein n=1 Tax=Actinomadura luteofluorescens TaxID=46163 RepID=UPI00363CE26C
MCGAQSDAGLVACLEQGFGVAVSGPADDQEFLDDLADLGDCFDAVAGVSSSGVDAHAVRTGAAVARFPKGGPSATPLMLNLPLGE